MSHSCKQPRGKRRTSETTDYEWPQKSRPRRIPPSRERARGARDAFALRFVRPGPGTAVGRQSCPVLLTIAHYPRSAPPAEPPSHAIQEAREQYAVFAAVPRRARRRNTPPAMWPPRWSFLNLG